MRVVSLVPSWTETLIECGITVVGRTRFCVHPKSNVAKIPAIGGTKGIDLEKLQSLQPDLVILDKEENTLQTAQQIQIPYFASHICSLADCERDLRELAARLNNKKMEELAERYKGIQHTPILKKTKWEEIPGVIEWIRHPDGNFKCL